MSLSQDSITFGKYNGKTLSELLRDRQYCKWLLNEDWFKNNYVYLFNRIKDYNPLQYFINEDKKSEDSSFLSTYKYFKLNEPNIEILNENENKCYRFYFNMIINFKNQIIQNIENKKDNPFNIKAPNKWLQEFENETELSRNILKDFLYAYELPNIPYIIEDIKREGGITYNGVNSFKIAKERSKKQEDWWEVILKSKYGEEINTQFKFKNCFFDFINIRTNTIFECKLNLKDFNDDQYEKYKLILNKYRIIYLIGTDCVIYIEKKRIYTTDPSKYFLYISQIKYNSKLSYIDNLIQDFKIIKINDISSLFGKNK